MNDLKKFQLKSYVHSKTLKIQLTNDMLQLSFQVDTKVNCNVRISACVTEQKNDMNVPIMFYTPNKDDYVQSIDLTPGMKQDILFGMIDFKLTAIAKYELAKMTDKYTPLIISINYSENGHNYAFIDYCVFILDS